MLIRACKSKIHNRKFRLLAHSKARNSPRKRA